MVQIRVFYWRRASSRWHPGNGPSMLPGERRICKPNKRSLIHINFSRISTFLDFKTTRCISEFEACYNGFIVLTIIDSWIRKPNPGLKVADKGCSLRINPLIIGPGHTSRSCGHCIQCLSLKVIDAWRGHLCRKDRIIISNWGSQPFLINSCIATGRNHHCIAQIIAL